MKKAVFFFGMLMSFTLTSCHFTEKITVAQDGTGNIEVVIDGAEAMKAAGDKLQGEMGKRIDSTVSLKEFFRDKKDSIALLSVEERAQLERLENADIHVLMDAATGEMLIAMKNSFKNVSEIGDAMQDLKKMNTIRKGGGVTQRISIGGNKAKTSYSFDGNVFKRKIKLPDNQVEASDETMQMLRSMFGESTYTVVYTFPRPVKKVSDDTAIISNGGKTVTVKRSFSDFIDHPEAGNLDVVLVK